ncbi:MAG: CvpA family protein [Eubacterium sp.]|nr:CvpA family protein [Eubacterium sp.]
MNWLFFTIIGIFLLFGFIGFKRGLIRTVLGMGAAILAMVLSYALSPVVSQWLRDHTQLDEKIEERVYTFVEEKVSDTVQGTEKKTKEKADKVAKEQMKKNPKKSEQIELIKNLNLPGFLTDRLLDGNNSDTYKELGVDTVYRYVAKSAAVVATNVIGGIATFLLLQIIFIIIALVIRGTLKALPIVNTVDKAVGCVAGFVIGLFIVWALLFILSISMKGDSYEKLLVDNSGIRWLSEHNPIHSIFVGKP